MICPNLLESLKYYIITVRPFETMIPVLMVMLQGQFSDNSDIVAHFQSGID